MLVDGFFYFGLVFALPNGNLALVKAFSFLMGASVGYWYQARFTFRSRYSFQTAFRFMIAITLVGATNVCFNQLLVAVFRGFLPYDLALAFLCSTGVSATLNYVLQSRVVFRQNGV